MGGDGGASVQRDIIVGHAQKRGLVQDFRLTNHGRYTNCAMSGLPFKKPLAACELGLIYSKEVVIQFLLDVAKKQEPKNDTEKMALKVLEDRQIQFAHISKLTDIIPMKMTLSSDVKAEQSTRKGVNMVVVNAHTPKTITGQSQDLTDYIVCPITQIIADGSQQFIIMRGCGCVMSLKGYEQIYGADQTIENPYDSTLPPLKACCLCLEPLGARYQDGYKADGTDITKPPIKLDDNTNTTTKPIKKTQAMIQYEQLLKFPLQEGELPFIYLIPPEKEAKILETIMLNKRIFLTRPLPEEIKFNIKKQRVLTEEKHLDALRLVQLDPLPNTIGKTNTTTTTTTTTSSLQPKTNSSIVPK